MQAWAIVNRIESFLNDNEDTTEPEEDSAASKQTGGEEPETRGDIDFENVFVSYEPELEPAVKELSFNLAAGKRLGIFGRSGSGKSNTLLALCRMTEMNRSRCVLMGGLWAALQKFNLSEFVKKQENKLDEVLFTDDSFISPGQKQLLSLARALLRERKILILDETTSAMGLKTNAAAQNVLSSQFSDCTVFAGAHRNVRIIDFDQIICMSAGRAIETGSAEELLKKRSEIWALAAEQNCV
uniref:Abc transporter c family member 12-like n=1 Tax=Melanopsichium pennsylvanicum 4 TaxID=1398559 RepID=A0A077QSI0_9BASI|nr:abc transporter c family member 12-like [Melanopsichium pennsylvanicum 4]